MLRAAACVYRHFPQRAAALFDPLSGRNVSNNANSGPSDIDPNLDLYKVAVALWACIRIVYVHLCLRAADMDHLDRAHTVGAQSLHMWQCPKKSPELLLLAPGRGTTICS